MQSAAADTTDVSRINNADQQLVLESRRQLKALQREMAEIKVLIKQSATEVERLSGPATDASRKVREIETNMDLFSRQEVRDFLTSGHDAEMRLFMMKGQVEMLEHKQRILDRLRLLLQAILDTLGGGGVEGQAIDEDEPAPERELVKGSAIGQPIVAQVMQAQETERQRLARQLHDGPAQALTNLILRAEICQRMLDLSPDDASAELASLRAMIVNALQETRGFIFDLRPMILDDLGLVPTLRRQAEVFAARSHVPVRLSVTGTERRLPPQTEVVIFRAVQEALDNAYRHGKATEIIISVEISADDIKVAVEDNGVGFDVNKVMAISKHRKVLGFRGVQEQVVAVGGHMSFESSPGQGAKVTVKVAV